MLPKKRQPPKRQPENVTAILVTIEENASVTFFQLKTIIRTQFNLDISVTTKKNIPDPHFKQRRLNHKWYKFLKTQMRM